MVKSFIVYGGHGKVRAWPVHMTVAIYTNFYDRHQTKPNHKAYKQYWDNVFDGSYVSHKSALWANQKNYGLSATEK